MQTDEGMWCSCGVTVGEAYMSHSLLTNSERHLSANPQHTHCTAHCIIILILCAILEEEGGCRWCGTKW